MTISHLYYQRNFTKLYKEEVGKIFFNFLCAKRKNFSVWENGTFMKCEMIDTLAISQPEKWLYEIRQKGVESTCYVMVPNANVCYIYCECNLILLVMV